jgi:hypothetical protein
MIVVYYSKLIYFFHNLLPAAFISNITTDAPFSSPSPLVKYWFYYYEIEILPNQDNDEAIIAIGLATKNYPTNRYLFL